MTTRADEATETLIFYFRTLYEAAGLDWGWENSVEIREAVNNIVADAVRLAIEGATRELRRDGPP